MRMISGFAERFYRAGRFPYGTLGGPVSFDQGKQGGTAYHTSHALHVVVCGIFLFHRVRPVKQKRFAGMRRYVDGRNKMEAGG